MKSMKVDGQDVEEVHKVASRALKHARDGKGPVFLLVETERLVGHYIGDPQVYRDKDELHRLQETRDPITLLREKLGVSDEEFEARRPRGARDRRGLGRVREGRHRSQARGRAEERLCLSSPTARPCATRSRRRCATTRTSSSWARTSPRWAARWASRRGCSTSSAPERIRNTPISEMAIVGAGIGAAMQGMRPVVEVMYEDFLTVSMEQIVNQAAKHRYMSGGQLKVPLTIRTQGGAGWSPGAQHAQQVEAWFVARAGAEGRLRLDADRRPRAALVGDLRRQPGRSSSSTARSTGSRRRCRTSSSRSRSARRACTARATT